MTRALGKSGNAINLDAVGDYVSVPNLGSHTIMTAMAWVKVDALGNAKNAIFHCNGWSAGATALSIANTGEVVFSIAGASAQDQTSLYKFTSADYGKWKHVAVVYDTSAKTAKFYIDGLPDATRNYTTAPTALLNGIRIGAWDGGGRDLRGKIDDFRIYSRALSDAEIAALGDTGELHGLRSQYYDNSNLTSLKLIRSDPNINFSWGTGTPDASIGADTFSVRWTGKLRPRFSEMYTFYTTTDDGVRLWVNGQQIINGWANGSAVRSGTIRLTAGQKYDIKMEYYEDTGSATAVLEWVSASQPREVVPASCIFAPEDYVDPSFAWYKFDETSGTTVTDSSGNARDGSMTGTYTRVVGKFGNAVNLNGSSGYAVLPTGLVQTLGDFSITAWVKLDTNGYWARIFDFGSGTDKYMFLCLREGSGIRYAIKLSGGGEQICDCPVALPTGVWKYVAVTQTGSTVTIYIDGIALAKSTGITNKPSALGSTTQNWIGRSQYNDPYLDGTVDDFRIYGWGLSATEVVAMAGDRPDNCIDYLKKHGAIGDNVLLVNKMVTWAAPGSYYIQCPDKSHPGCGIKVVGGTTQTIGTTATVSGALAKDTNDELIVNATLDGPGTVKDAHKPIGLVNKAVGGGDFGLQCGVWGWNIAKNTSGNKYRLWAKSGGLNNIGQLVTAWGKYSPVNSSTFTIDDGSDVDIKCVVPDGVTLGADWTYVRVTGISSCEKVGSELHSVIRARSQEDIVPIQ